MAARSAAGRHAHACCASRAAVTAAATSSGRPFGTSPIVTPVNGASTGIVSWGSATAARAARRANMAGLTLGE